MSKLAKLSVGDRWTYEKSFSHEKPKVISKYEVIGSEKIENTKTLILSFKEKLKGRERPLISGKFWIEEETERFVKGERTFYDGLGNMLETETLEKSKLENWGIKGHARVPESLEVGERWSFEDFERKNRVSVMSSEEVSVPAGEFECYAIETEVQKNDLEFTFRSWYSRGIGILVKSISQTLEGKTRGRTMLVSQTIEKSQ